MNNNIQKYMYWLLLVFLAVGFFLSAYWTNCYYMYGRTSFSCIL